MRQPNPMILADLIREKAVSRPDFEVLTFEHLSLDDEATPDEVRAYAGLANNADRIAATLVADGMRRGDRFGLMMRNHFINPGFLEKAIAEHPSVRDVFVYGVPAASGAPGEKDVVAAVVPVDRATFDPAALLAACRRSLEANFVPSYIQVVDEIPKTASEKPQERFLLEALSSGSADVLKDRSAP